MNSKECNFSFETIFEITSDEFRTNVIRPNDLPRPRTIGDFLNDFGGWKIIIILVILYRILVKNH
jgi:hypothetical protein